jgi:hypothetical protein
MSKEILDIILNSSVAVMIAGGLIGAVKIGYAEFKKWRLKKKKVKIEVDYLARLRSIATAYSIMDKIRYIKQVDRVFLLEVSNGGSKPRLGAKMYARAIELKLDEKFATSTRDALLAKYNEVMIDESYIRMVIELAEKGHYDFDIDKEHDCLLKQHYSAEGVRFSRVFHIYTDHEEEKMFILSVATFGDDKLNDKKLKDVIQSEVNEIRDYFRKYRA